MEPFNITCHVTRCTQVQEQCASILIVFINLEFSLGLSTNISPIIIMGGVDSIIIELSNILGITFLLETICLNVARIASIPTLCFVLEVCSTIQTITSFGFSSSTPIFMIRFGIRILYVVSSLIVLPTIYSYFSSVHNPHWSVG